MKNSREIQKSEYEIKTLFLLQIEKTIDRAYRVWYGK